jgi:heme/copper-type cytochrome/quinol oxidase subunit 2
MFESFSTLLDYSAYKDMATFVSASSIGVDIDFLNLGSDVYYLDAPLTDMGSATTLAMLDQTSAILHYSVPTVKLAYPEPFIASASLMHSDLWFIHILIYQYWLWFIFVFIIVFFFITFISVVRWCNVRVRPRRETRGVSRSKCGDLITACVPVSWATSIIVHESTDAIDLYDGFGTSELVIGIRAYQWGWEYYYPKDLDINYRLKQNFAFLVGNSFKYESSSSKTLGSQGLWKFYQLKNTDTVVNPLMPLMATDASGLLNLFDFTSIGASPASEGEAFSRSRGMSKLAAMRTLIVSDQPSLAQTHLSAPSFDTFQNVYRSLTYGLRRQINFLPNRDLVGGNATWFEASRKGEKPSTSFLTVTGNGLALTQNSSNSFFPSLTGTEDSYHLAFPSKTHARNIDLVVLAEVLPTRLSRESFANDTRFTHGEKLLRNGVSNPLQATSFNFLPSSDLKLNELESSLRSGGLFDSHAYRMGDTPLFNANIVRAHGGLNTYFDLSAGPITTSQGWYSPYNFDSTVSSRSPVPVVFQSKDDTIVSNVTSVYWNSLWAASAPEWRLESGAQFRAVEALAVPALFSVFYDYEFRNWQAIELLEESLWEDMTPGNGLYELYDNLIGDGLSLKISKTDLTYWDINRVLSRKDLRALGVIDNLEELLPLLAELNTFALEGSLVTPADHSWNRSSPLLTTYSNLQGIEGASEAVSGWRHLVEIGGHHVSVYKGLTNMSVPFTTTLNAFRADWDGSAEVSYEVLTDTSSHYAPSRNEWTAPMLATPSLYPLYTANGVEVSDALPLRQTAKNLIVSSNALLKVFKSRYDDNRALARLSDFTELASAQLLISGTRAPYEQFLTKVTNPMIAVKFFTSRPLLAGMLSTRLLHLQNFPLFDMPFLEAAKSEASRHIWVDWYARWGFADIQPASSSRYAIFGMPYFNRGFNFSAATNILFTESENYFTRISRARRNYLPTCVFAPHILTHNRSLGTSLAATAAYEDFNNFGVHAQLHLWEIQESWGRRKPSPLKAYPFASGFSSTNLYSKSAPLAPTKANAYLTSHVNLEDSLTRKMHLLRVLDYAAKSELNANSLRLEPNHLRHPMTVVDDIFTEMRKQATPSILTVPTYPGELEGHFKNQYRPMRKGINNLLRLHATGAIAIPTEIRLQVLASSKDVIHSWSVPSAGIKIDCVPGYSSHRIMMFLVSGIFWGQCMEVCGRYHHWMPIVVYFMKRDLFWLWCSHFIFFTPSTNQFTSADRQLGDRLGLVSFDRMGWLEELK